MIKFWKLPLWIQVSFLTLTVTSVIALIVGKIYMNRETEYLKNNMYKKSEAMFRVTKSAIIEGLITEDSPVLQTVLNEISDSLESVQNITIQNRDGITLAEWKAKRPINPDYTLSFDREVSYEGELFGKVSISWDTYAESIRINKHVMNWDLVLFAVLAILASSIILIFHFLAIRHVNKINNSIKTLSNNSEEFKQVSLSFASTELINLGDSINTLAKVLNQNKIIENELIEHRDHLEKLVYDQTRELRVTNKQLLSEIEERNRVEIDLEESLAELQKSQSMLFQQEKLASLGQLAAGVAHEINNPIGFVQSNLLTLKKYVKNLTTYMSETEDLITKELTVDALTVISEIKKKTRLNHIMLDLSDLIDESLDGTSRVSGIVTDLKEYAHTDDSILKECNLNNVMQQAVKILTNEIKYKAIVDGQYGDIPPINCFPQQLSQVFINLIMNGVQAIESNGKITVKTWSEGTTAMVSITDNGCGISEDKMTSIFDPFFTTKPVGVGTGMGLSICYEIIKKHNGEIRVDSSVGEYTTFTIVLPRMELSEPGEEYQI